MRDEKLKAMGCTTLEELLDREYGPKGTPERDRFERDAEAFIRAECMKEKYRKIKAHLKKEECLKMKTDIHSKALFFVHYSLFTVHHFSGVLASVAVRKS